jgi:hypothetical protein
MIMTRSIESPQVMLIPAKITAAQIPVVHDAHDWLLAPQTAG